MPKELYGVGTWILRLKVMYQNQFNQDELLNQEELAIVRGGLMEASSAQMESCEMGSSSCCNIHIDFWFLWR